MLKIRFAIFCLVFLQFPVQMKKRATTTATKKNNQQRQKRKPRQTQTIILGHQIDSAIVIRVIPLRVKLFRWIFFGAAIFWNTINNERFVLFFPSVLIRLFYFQYKEQKSHFRFEWIKCVALHRIPIPKPKQTKKRDEVILSNRYQVELEMKKNLQS